MSYIQSIFITISLFFMLQGCVGLDPKTGDMSVVVPIKVIDTKVQQKFPLTQKLQLGSVKFYDPSVQGDSVSKEKLQITLSFMYSYFLLPTGITGGVSILSGIRYDQKTKNLYLKDPKIKDIWFQNNSMMKLFSPVMKDELAKLLSLYLENYPIYSLKDQGYQASFVKDISIQDQDIYLRLGW